MAEGFETIQDLAQADVEDLVNIEGVGDKKAVNLIQKAKDYLKPAKPSN
jgi:transcription termination factor NusA